MPYHKDMKITTITFDYIPSLEELYKESRQFGFNDLVQYEVNGLQFGYFPQIGVSVEVNKFHKQHSDFCIVDDHLNKEFEDEFRCILHSNGRAVLSEVYDVEEFKDFMSGNHLQFLLEIC